jgi:UDP-N-acetylmuramate--alanine ligase
MTSRQMKRVSVFFSTAITNEHPWRESVRKSGAKQYHRSDLLAYFVSQRKSISVLGAHGKTSTSTMASFFFEEIGQEPSFIIGGKTKNFDTHARLTDSDWLIFEADESDGSFVKYQPEAIILLNLDNDHLNYYGSLENMIQTFQGYFNSLSEETLLIYNNGDEIIKSLDLSKIKNKASFGYNGSDYSLNLRTPRDFSINDIRFKTSFWGEHHASNFTAVFALADKLGLIKKSEYDLQNYQGVKRRNDIIFQNDQLIIIDDYAHHPTEISSTIKAVKNNFNKPVYVIHQPHRYTRTEECWDLYKDCFNEADEVFLMEIFSAGEVARKDITSNNLLAEIKTNKPRKLIKDINEVFNNIKKGVVLAMGAGSISAKIREYAKNIK